MFDLFKGFFLLLLVVEALLSCQILKNWKFLTGNNRWDFFRLKMFLN